VGPSSVSAPPWGAMVSGAFERFAGAAAGRGGALAMLGGAADGAIALRVAGAGAAGGLGRLPVATASGTGGDDDSRGIRMVATFFGSISEGPLEVAGGVGLAAGLGGQGEFGRPPTDLVLSLMSTGGSSRETRRSGALCSRSPTRS